jgi:hypothetical protein
VDRAVEKTAKPRFGVLVTLADPGTAARGIES